MTLNCLMPLHIGSYSCKGFDTYGPFKYIGGLGKGHPDEVEVNAAVDFYGNIVNNYNNGQQ